MANVLKTSRLLEDFPVLDTSLDDDPNFRRQMNKWSQKTEKVITSIIVIACVMWGGLYAVVGVQPTGGRGQSFEFQKPRSGPLQLRLTVGVKFNGTRCSTRGL